METIDIIIDISIESTRSLPYGWLSVYVRGDPVGYAQAGELYELGGPGVESEGLVDVVLPDDALRVVVLKPSFPYVGQLDLHLAITSNSVRIGVTILDIEYPSES